jgi:integrase/recombinase XerD
MDFKRAKALTPDVIDSICELWLQEGYQENRLQRSSMQTYINTLNLFRVYLQQIRCTKPRKKHVIEFLQSFRFRRRSALYVNSLRSALKGFFSYAEKLSYYPDITKSIRRFRVPKGHRKKALYPDQVETLLKGMETQTEYQKRNFVMLVLICSTGIRAAACCSLRVRDFVQRESGYAVIVKLKGYAAPDHEIPLDQSVSDLILEYLQLRGKYKLDDALFTNRWNRHLCPSSLSKIFHRAFVESGVRETKVSLHSLRHTFATVASHNGVGLDCISDVLGHSSYAITEDIYTHKTDLDRKTVVQRVSEILNLKVITKNAIQKITFLTQK